MKKILTAVVVVAFAAIANAAPPPAEVVLQAKPGNVTFNHKAHQGQGCKKCHGEGAPGKIALDKDKAHALCGDCHVEKAKGPSPKDAKACGTCHKK